MNERGTSVIKSNSRLLQIFILDKNIHKFLRVHHKTSLLAPLLHLKDYSRNYHSYGQKSSNLCRAVLQVWWQLFAAMPSSSFCLNSSFPFTVFLSSIRFRTGNHPPSEPPLCYLKQTRFIQFAVVLEASHSSGHSNNPPCVSDSPSALCLRVIRFL